MTNFYVSDSASEKALKYKQNKENRRKQREYKKVKKNTYVVTSIILILTLCLTASIIVASGLFVKNTLLVNELSLYRQSYMKAVEHYENLQEDTADNAVNDFINELTGEILSIEPTSLTKSKLKSYIAEAEGYIQNFEALGLASTHPEVFEQLNNKLEEANYSLENGTYLYPYSDKDYILLCNLVQYEQGSDVSDDLAQLLTASVPLNRQKYGTIYAKSAKDPSNPTLLEVVLQKNQYSGSEQYSYNMNLNGVTEKVQENVRKVFEHEFECPENVMFQTMKYYPPSQKTMYMKVWNPAPFNKYTYFYYGRTE